MPPPRLPFPDPAIPLAQAIANVAGCYPDNAAVRALTAAATCQGADEGDLQALLSLVIAAALCDASNKTPCCDADPFEVANLQVAANWTTLNLAVGATALVMGNVTATGTLCMPRNFQPAHLNNALILGIDETGCFKYFPKSDLDPESLHLPGNLIVDGATQLFTLHQYSDATFGHDWNLGTNLNITGHLCVDGLPETAWSDDAHMVFVRGNGCLKMTPAGRCCQTAVCCPPFTFDPDLVGYPDPDIFPQLNPPPGVNTQCEVPLYSVPDNPSPGADWITCNQMVTSGNIIDSGYAPGITFALILPNSVYPTCPTIQRTLYYNNGSSAWQTTEPTFGSDGNVTYYVVNWFTFGYTVYFGSTDPGHEYVKPLYDGAVFDENHRCPGDS